MQSMLGANYLVVLAVDTVKISMPTDCPRMCAACVEFLCDIYHFHFVPKQLADGLDSIQAMYHGPDFVTIN